jgi:Tfp pilus assembly protein PilF
LVAAICVALALSVGAVYWPVRSHQFVNFDDLGYIIQNPYAQAGLTWQGVAWAFTSGYAANWHPLTWLTHMLDCQLFGLNAGGHHLTSVLLHIANTVVLFLLLQRMTGAVWRSAFVAALFGLHPLHVESVAWVSERKDVLCALFGLLSIWAYVRSRERGAGSKEQGATCQEPSSRITYHASRLYLLSLLLFALGLMSKPMLVTLPFVLLLLDYWPLGRVTGDEWRVTGAAGSGERGAGSGLRVCLVDKIPFFLLAAASCVVTFLAQQHSGAVADAANVPLEHRLPNAIVSYVTYLGKIFWPTKLAVYYPYRATMPPAITVIWMVILALVTAVAFTSLRRKPWLAVGWLWYLGMLVPVIGLVQVGLQAMADRYTYLPAIGIFLMVAWSVGEVRGSRVEGQDYVARLTNQPRLLGAVALAIVSACAVLSSAQVHTWKDSETLYRHALTVTSDNAIVHGNLGSALIEQHRFAEAAGEFAEALRIKPGYAEAEGNWGFALALQGKVDEAIAHYHKALELKPDLERTHFTLGQALLMQGKRDEAIAEYRAALQINPDWPAAANDLAWILATDADEHIRDGAKAVELAERACRLTGLRETLFVGTLAAAYAEAGDFKNAVGTAEKARDLAKARGQPELARRNEELLELYRAGKPYREAAPKGANP